MLDMKSYVLAFSLAALPAAICAQQADPCAGLVGSALGQCRGDQRKLQQQQLEQQQEQLRQQQERQNQLAEQQRQMQQQLENMRLQSFFKSNWSMTNRQINLFKHRRRSIRILEKLRVGSPTTRGSGWTMRERTLRCDMPSNFSESSQIWLVVHFLTPYQQR